MAPYTDVGLKVVVEGSLERKEYAGSGENLVTNAISLNRNSNRFSHKIYIHMYRSNTAIKGIVRLIRCWSIGVLKSWDAGALGC